MKNKLIALTTVLLLVVSVVLAMSTTVNATTASEDLLTFLSKSFDVNGEAVSLTDAQKLKVERYLNDNPVTEAQAEGVKSKVNEAVSYVKETGVKDLSKLTATQKQTLLAKANEAAAVVDLSLTYSSKDQAVQVYSGSKLVDSVKVSNKLAQTGGINSAVVAVSVLAIIAVAIVAVKKLSK